MKPGDILVCKGPLPPQEAVFYKRMTLWRFWWLRLTGRIRRAP